MLVAYWFLSFPFSVCAYSFLSIFLLNILSPSHECLRFFLISLSFSLSISFVLCFFLSFFISFFRSVFASFLPYFFIWFFLCVFLYSFSSFVLLLFLSVFLPFFPGLSLFLSIFLSVFSSFFLSLKPNSLCFVLSLFLSFLHFLLSFCLCFFPYLCLSFVFCLFVSFFLSFVRGAKNQEPLKARTCRKSPRGEPNQGRAKPLKKKHGPSGKTETLHCAFSIELLCGNPCKHTRPEKQTVPLAIIAPSINLVCHLCYSHSVPLRVQVRNDHILAQNLYHNCYYPKLKNLSNYWVHGPSG